ncbi:hypothetical protein [Pinibacter aurantiacus]|uniref:DoxX family membrane protein n=1 Tax=Pinibacter aurantiacus TaxID=2851599 RepID=A0A9E2W9V4_9BACT|nr:hypothetical protein [Pinibacter aurantiacus]MBV4360661.1 hypothetical protein [Pinibacter aurantiacus]
MENTNVNQTLRPTFYLLKLTFGLVPIVAGLDKFTNLLTNWEQYLSPKMAGMLPLQPHAFMMVVGVIEIVAGVIVLLKPAVGGIIVATWLTLIALTLIFGGHYFDVAVRDLVMAISAYSMTRLAKTVA